MKLDDLTPTELECYENWNLADHKGGNCDGIGYAWAAWDTDRVIITENDQGFVVADTYNADDGTGENAYCKRVNALTEIDDKYYAGQGPRERTHDEELASSLDSNRHPLYDEPYRSDFGRYCL